MKLELKHLAPYLPYGLKVRDSHTELNYEVCGYNNDEEEYFIYTDEGVEQFCSNLLIPILRPLSDLTEENKVELNKIDPNLSYVKGEMPSFKVESSYECVPMRNTQNVFNKLIEWHFDVFGLIEKGLAIDINQLEK